MNLKEIKNKLSNLYSQNKLLLSLNKEKDRIIDELMYKIEQLESDLEYSKNDGGIKKLILTNKNMIKYN